MIFLIKLWYQIIAIFASYILCFSFFFSFDIPIGYYCDDIQGTVVPTLCPIKYYCPKGAQQPIACHPGTVGGSTGLSECTPCPPTKYCDDTTGVNGPKGKNTYFISL
jgi:hypothetical protein